MPMTVIVTSDVRARFRGFLASCMCEMAPGVYTAPRMTASIRNRVWSVLEEWFDDLQDGSIVMTWPSREAVGGQDFSMLGVPRKSLWQVDGIFMARTLPAGVESDHPDATERDL